MAKFQFIGVTPVRLLELEINRNLEIAVVDNKRGQLNFDARGFVLNEKSNQQSEQETSSMKTRNKKMF